MSSPTVRVLASAEETGKALSRDLEGARSVSVAVAFAKPSAWEAVDLRAWCAPERSLRLVVGTDFAITDLDVLRDLGARPSTHCKVMHRAATANVSFHPKLYLTGRSEIVAMGMFTGEPYWDDSPRWQQMDARGGFPWRIRFIPLGELRVGVPTKRVLEPLRPGAAKNWFHGFIQASHSLEPEDFEALRAAFEPGLRADRALT